MIKNYFKRIILMIAGLFFIALGVAISVKANLGTSPISSGPFVYSTKFPFLSMGTITIFMHTFFLLMQIVILRKQYKLIQLIQLPVVFMFGFFTDFTLALISARNYVNNYALQCALCLLSCIIIAFGFFIEVKSHVTYLAADGLMVTISQYFHLDFGKVKICFDCSLVAIAIVSSLIFFHTLKGVREGTVAAAILVGMFVRLFNKKLTFIDQLVETKQQIGNSCN